MIAVHVTPMFRHFDLCFCFLFLILFWYCLQYICLFFTQFSHLPTPCFCRPLPYGMPVPPSRKAWTCFCKKVMWGIPVNQLHGVWMRTLITAHTQSFRAYGPLPYRSSAQEREQSEDLLVSRALWHFYRAVPLLCLFSFFRIELVCEVHTLAFLPVFKTVCPRRHSLRICTKAPVYCDCEKLKGVYKHTRALPASGFFRADLMSLSSPETTLCGQLHSGAVCVSLTGRLCCFAGATFSSA